MGEHIWLRLLGVTAAGTSTAAWIGVLDRRTADWDPELPEACGVSVERLSEIRNPDRPIDEVDQEVGRRWPTLAGAVWFRLPVVLPARLVVGGTTGVREGM